MNPHTRDNLLKAMHCEAFTSMKYSLFAQQARRNGREELATLFEKTAMVEHMEHFAEEAKLASLLGSDDENLLNAIQGESFEVDSMYPEFAGQAATAGDNAVAARFSEVGRDELAHRDAFRAALQKVETNKDAKGGIAKPANAVASRVTIRAKKLAQRPSAAISAA